MEQFIPTTGQIDERIRSMKSSIANNPPETCVDCLHCKVAAAVMRSEEATRLSLNALKLYADPLEAFAKMYALGMADGLHMAEARELERIANV